MRHIQRKKIIRSLLLLAIILTGLFDALVLSGAIDARAFSTQWSEAWNSDDRWDWQKYKIGDCGGQSHSVSGGALHMSASYGTDCFGAYYRTNSDHPGMFARSQDIRVMWRWRYPDRNKYGTQAGQLTGNYGWPQYYGLSAVDTGGSGNTNDSWHIVTDGPWGTNTVDNAVRYGTDTNWHVSTFDWLCDGSNLTWWLDSASIKTASYNLPANHESRPWQFWQGNLLTGTPSNGAWTPFDIDYLQIYTVERPQLNSPTPGGGGVQTVSWNAVPNTTQPDGSTWTIEYQVQACGNSTCSSVVQSSPWQSGTSYTFSGLPLNQTYTYRARAKWVGAPELVTCWGNTVAAAMTGAPELTISKSAPTTVQYGDTIRYSITVRNIGDAPATNVVVTDPPPAGVRLPGSSPAPGSPMAAVINNGGSYSGGQLRWSLGTVGAGASATVSWETGLEAAVPTTISQLINTARASGDGGLDVSATAVSQVLQPNLVIRKSGPATGYAGGPLTFQIEVENQGTGRAIEAKVFDLWRGSLLENLRNISGGGSYVANMSADSFNTICPASSSTYSDFLNQPGLRWNFNSLEAGETRTLSYTADVRTAWNPATDGTSLLNIAQYCHWHSGNEPADSSTTQLIPPQLTLTKSGPADIWSGDPFSYQITARNSGTVPIVNLSLSDPVPAYIFNPANISSGGSLSGGVIRWSNLAQLAPGQTLTFGWDFELDGATPTSVSEITNRVTATAAGSLNKQAQATSAVAFPVMALTKNATASVYPGAPISYTVRVANSGGGLMQQLVITDAIPAYVTDISGISHGGQLAGDQIVWRLPDRLSGGEYLELSWHGQVDENTPRYETEIVNQIEGTALSTGDTAEATSVLGFPAMALTKRGPASTAPGQLIEYTISVENSGSAPLLDVVIRDPVPAYLTGVEVPAGTLTGGIITWNFERLEPGERQELLWRATVADDIPDNITLLVNRVTGTALGNIEERAETAASLLFPQLLLVKRGTPEVWPGGEIEYSIQVENAGAIDLEDVVITDFIPDFVLDPVAISHGGFVDGDEIVWELGDLVSGATFELTWAGTVDPAIPEKYSLIRNQVQGKAAYGVRAVAETTSLTLYPSLVANKSGTGQAGPGDPVQYVITVQNASAAPVDGVVVVDAIPEYIIEPGAISGGGRVEGTEIIWELGRLNGGESRTLLWEGIIDRGVPLGRKYLDNTVTVCDESGRFCDEAVYRMRLLQADARVTKSATPYGHPGSEVEYTIRVQNTGETDLEGVVINDPLPDWIEYPHDISGDGEAITSPFEDKIGVVWRIERLPVGDSVELSWKGRVKVATPASVYAIENVVTVTDRRGLAREASGSTYLMHPQLRLVKTATPAAGPGETVEYSLALENPGLVPVYEVELVDLIPTYILEPIAISGGGLLQADDITWRWDELAPGQVVTLTWRGTVNPDIPATVAQLVNTAEASNPAGALAEDTAVTDLSGQTLALRKAATAVVEPGGGVAYELTLENRGQAALSGLTLTDPIPEYVENPTNISGGGSAANGIEVVWEIDSLQPGERLTVGWQGVVARDIPAGETELINEATLTTAGGLALTARARSLVRQPLLALDKQATLLAGPGEVITYALTVRNLGGAAAYDVTVTDPIPDYLATESGSPGVELAANQIRLRLPDPLPPAASRSFTWTARVDPHLPFDETQIVNVATATDSGGRMATADATTALKPQQLYLSKDATPVVYPGAGMDYTMTVENRGEAVLYDLVLIDPVPEFVRDARDITGGGAIDGNAQLRWEFDALAPGQVMTLTWRGTVAEDIPAPVTLLWNEAVLDSGSGLTAAARAKSLVRRARLTLDKQATPAAGPGELVYYFLTVTNRGEAPAYGALVTDPIPAGIDFGGVDNGGEWRGDALRWMVDVIEPGQAATLGWYGAVALDVPVEANEIINTAAVELPDGSRTEATAVTLLRPQQVRLFKQAAPQVYAGGVVTYTLLVENTSDTALYDLAVNDPVPDYVENARVMTFTHGAATAGGNLAVGWDIPALAGGETAGLVWVGQVSRALPSRQDEIINYATLASGGGLVGQAEARSLVRRPELALDKTATPQAGPGETIVYTLTLRNLGEAPAFEVLVTDLLPDWLREPVDLSGGGLVQADAVRWSIADLSPGAGVTLSWQGTVAGDTPADLTRLVNSATATWGDETVTAQAVTWLKPQAVGLAKAASYQVYPGGPVTYTLTVANRGEAALYGVTVSDPIPETIINPTGLSAGGRLEGNAAVVWDIPLLAAGESLDLSWQGTVNPDLSGGVTEIVNKATVTTAGGLQAEASARSRLTRPTLWLDKTATLEAGPGDTVAYTLTLRNPGQAPAYDLTVTDPLPTWIANPTGVSGGGEIRAAELVWRLAELAAGDSVVLTWQGTVAGSVPETVDQVVNTVTATDSAGHRVEAEALTWLRRQGVALRKAAPSQVGPGETIVYTLTLENRSGAALAGITVSDPIPDGILNPTAISDGGRADGNETVLWDIASLAAGESRVLSWRGTVDPALPPGQTELINEATLVTESGLTAEARARSLVYQPVLVLDKLATPLAGPGQTIVYTLTVANAGQAPAYGVEVTDLLPPEILNPSGVTGGGVVQADAITWRFDRLDAGEIRTLAWHGTLDPELPADVTYIENTATVRAGGGRSASDAAVTAVAAQRLYLAKDATYLAGPGETIAYTLTLRNLGQAALYDLVVTDPIPDHILDPGQISKGGDLDGNTTVRWELAQLSPGETALLSWQGTLDPNLPVKVTEIENTAGVTSRGGLTAEAAARTRLLRPALRLTKLAPATVGLGGPISYTLIVENSGLVPAVDVELHDPIPADVLSPGQISNGGFVDYLPAYEVRWKLGELAPWERRTVSWQGRVDPLLPLDAGQSRLVNRATAEAAGGVTAQAEAQSTVLPPRFELAKLAPPQVGPGETLIYTLVLTNSGQTLVSDLLVIDDIPDYLIPLETGSGVLEDDWRQGRRLRWQPAPLAVGETRLITWTARVDFDLPGDLTSLENRVTATAPPDLIRRATAVTALVWPRVSLVKTAEPPLIDAGDTLEYTLVVSNSGPSTLFDVTLTDPSPDFLSPLFVNDGGRVEDGVVIWRLGDLKPGDTRAVSWIGRLAADAPLALVELRNEAVVTAAARARATAWVTTTVRRPVLELRKTGPAQVQPGETVEYRLTLTNSGYVPAQGVVVTDTLPPSVTLLDADGGITSSGVVTWTVGELAAGESWTVALTTEVSPDIPAGQSVVNRAFATAAGGLWVEADSVADLRRPQLLLVKQGEGLPSPGVTLTYTLRLRNGGDGPARATTLTDPLPRDLTFISASPLATVTDGELRWQPGLLAPGDGFDAVWTARVSFDLPETTPAITNTAEANSPDATRPVTATAILPVAPPLMGAQLLCPPVGQAGQTLSYTLRLHNSGGTLLTPTLVLTIPPGTIYVPDSATLDGQFESGRTDIWGDPLPDRLRWTLPPLYPGDRRQPLFALTVSEAVNEVLWAEADLISRAERPLTTFGCATTLHTPRLGLTKAGPNRALVGDIVEYTLGISNTGEVIAYDTILTDTLPPGLAYEPGSTAATVITRTNPGGWPEMRLVWPLGTLAPGQKVEKRYRAEVGLPFEATDYPIAFNDQGEIILENQAMAVARNATPVEATRLTNVPRPVLELTRQAVVEADETGISYGTAGDNIVATGNDISPVGQPLALTALGDSPDVAAAVQAWPGSRIVHTLQGSNLGPGVARQSRLVERGPTGLTVLTDTISHAGSYDPATHSITWVLGDLAAGQQIERTYTLAVPLSLRPDITTLAHNQAELSSIDAPSAVALAATTLDSDFSLAAVKSAPRYATPGGELTYTLRLQNISRGPLDQVVINDPLPAYTTYLTGSASLPPEISGEGLRWNLGLLRSGEVREVSFRVRVAGDLPDWLLQVRNQAEVTFTGGEPVVVEAISRLPGVSLTPTPAPTATPRPTEPSGGGGDTQPPAPTPVQTVILRTTAVVSPLVTVTPTLTPTGTPVTPSPTPRPQPLLHKSVSTTTVPAGQVTLVTWRLAFTNPTPLTIGELVVRDLLPDGLLYVGAETSRGVIEISERSANGREERLTPTALPPTLTPRPTRPYDYNTGFEAALSFPASLSATRVTSDGVPLSTATATATPETVDLIGLPGVADVPLTEVVFRVGDLPPGGQVVMLVKTLVLSDAVAGTTYDNAATFAALNMDPGASNRVAVTVVSRQPRFLLPVTGGLLELIDPRTPQGRLSWLGLLILAVAGGMLWRWRLKKAFDKRPKKA